MREKEGQRWEDLAAQLLHLSQLGRAEEAGEVYSAQPLHDGGQQVGVD